MNKILIRYISRALAVAILLGVSVLFAQETSEKNTTDTNAGDIVYDHFTKGMTPPRAIYQPDAEYTDKARKKKLNGVVVLSLIVTPEGTTRDIKVLKSLDAGLDKNAIAAASKWKFQPATKDGQPVTCRVAAEVNFRLY